jgi:hypothetical protein
MEPAVDTRRETKTRDAGASGRRRLVEAGVAALGIGAGVALANPVLAAAAGVWHGFILPGYDAVVQSGVFAFCL